MGIGNTWLAAYYKLVLRYGFCIEELYLVTVDILRLTMHLIEI